MVMRNKKSVDSQQYKSIFTRKIEKLTRTTLESYSLYIAESAWLATIVSFGVFAAGLLVAIKTKSQISFWDELLTAGNNFISMFLLALLAYVISALFKERLEHSKNESRKLLSSVIAGAVALSFCIYTSIQYFY